MDVGSSGRTAPNEPAAVCLSGGV